MLIRQIQRGRAGLTASAQALGGSFGWPTAVSSVSIGVPAMAYWSDAQAPKSINLQRLEQNGRDGFSGEYGENSPH
jgi:hypothetical protein